MHIIQINTIDTDSKCLLPLYEERVPAGFPSPADDFVEAKLDLNEHLIQHPAATFFMRMSGNEMADAGISDGDILVVDRSLDPQHGSIVVAIVDGEMILRRVSLRHPHPFIVWGVVTYVIHKPS